MAGSPGSSQPAGHVGQEHDLVGAQRPGHGAGGLVGVDVVRVALAVGADAGHDRDVVLRDVGQHVDVDALDPADEADVLAARRGLARGAEQQPVVAAQPDRGLAVAVEAQHDVLVDLAHQHHLRDLDGLGVRHPQAVDELHRQAEPLHVARDLRAAAVHDHRVHPDVLEQHDVARELLAQRGVVHRRAAVLDHHGLAVELADVGQRLEQRGDVAHALRVVRRRAVARSCTRHYATYREPEGRRSTARSRRPRPAGRSRTRPPPPTAAFSASASWGTYCAARAHRDALDGDVDLQRRGSRHRLADGLDRPAPSSGRRRTARS